MNTSPDPCEIRTPAVSREPAAARGAAGVWVRRLWSVPWKLAVGTWLTQTWLGGLLVAGWMQRWTCRAAVRRWWVLAGKPGRRLDAAAGVLPELAGFARAPHWISGPPVGALGAGPGESPKGFLAGLRLNFRLGLQALLNTLALTLPGGVLMLLGWWGGWQNSFHKGYEEFLVGPTVSWLGILLFIAAMFYLPMALARQAVTGQWREFWRGSTVWTVVRHGWAGCAGLALLAAALNLGVMGLKAWPSFVPQAKTSERIRALVATGLDPREAARQLSFPVGEPDWNRLTEDEARRILDRHFLASGLAVFLALLVLRGWAGRVYAGALVRAVRRGALGEEQLSEAEWRTLSALGLLRTEEGPRRVWLVRAAVWAASRTGRFVCAALVFAGWFFFIGFAYVSAFLAYHPIVSFLNQPLMQWPVFRYVPAHLEDPAPAWVLTVLVLAGVWVGRRVLRRFRRREADGPGRDCT